jgi:hypothetical protein
MIKKTESTSVPELIAYVKANPGKISLASFGSGTISQVAGELFKMTAGIEMVQAPRPWSRICSVGRFRLPSITCRHRSSTSGRANCVPSLS